MTILRPCLNPLIIATLTEVWLRACAKALTLKVRLLEQRRLLVDQRQQAEAYLTTMSLLREESRFLLSIRGLGVVNAAGLLAYL